MRGIDPSEFAALKAEVAALRASVAGPVTPLSVAPQRRGRSRLHRAILAASFTALLVAMPMLVSASHQFSDVAATNTFHTSIDNLYGARLTGGCGGGKFCPGDDVTRGQMAAFLNRSLGRAIGDAGVVEDDWTELDAGPAGQVTLRSGGGTGGSAYVWVQGTLSAWTDEAGICPCEIELWLFTATTLERSAPMWQVIGTDSVGGLYEGSVSVSHLFAVPSGINVNYDLYAKITSQLAPSPENNAGYAFDMTAMYLPFDWDGTNPVIPSTKGSTSYERSVHGD